MSCVPLFSLRPVISAAFGSFHDTADSDVGEQRSVGRATTPTSTNEVDNLYDKLLQVSISHRRVDSFEWVMTQSAPNTPPSTLDSRQKPFLPPPPRLVNSEPLPVPGEMWSIGPQPCQEISKRGSFDWWPSPSLRPSGGYTRISIVEDEDEPEEQLQTLASPTSIAAPSRWHDLGDGRKATAISPVESNHLQSPQELNALGIVLPCTPSHSAPPPSARSRESVPKAMPRLSKRVSFSPVVDEVVPEAFPHFDSKSQPASHWSSYFPSSFVVARPPLLRSTSSPLLHRNKATRPILKRSASSISETAQNAFPGTEMIDHPKKANVETTAAVSLIPTQRLSATNLDGGGQRKVEKSSDNTDSVFAAILQAPRKSGRLRCDSLLSNVSGPVY